MKFQVWSVYLVTNTGRRDAREQNHELQTRWTDILHSSFCLVLFSMTLRSPLPQYDHDLSLTDLEASLFHALKGLARGSQALGLTGCACMCEGVGAGSEFQSLLAAMPIKARSTQRKKLLFTNQHERTASNKHHLFNHNAT